MRSRLVQVLPLVVALESVQGTWRYSVGRVRQSLRDLRQQPCQAAAAVVVVRVSSGSEQESTKVRHCRTAALARR